MKYKTFKEELPPEKTWLDVLYYGKHSGYEYYYGFVNGLPLFADNESVSYIYTAGEDDITHWKLKE